MWYHLIYFPSRSKNNDDDDEEEEGEEEEDDDWLQGSRKAARICFWKYRVS